MTQTIPVQLTLPRQAQETPLLEVRHLTKQYTSDGPKEVNDVSFDLNNREVLALVGPSGCGKTTTLRLIAGFEKADSGEIDLQGQPMVKAGSSHEVHTPPHKRGIGIVFQDYALFPHLSVLGNVMFGTRGSTRSRQARAMELLDMLHMSEFASRRPHALSGGQQQRVALARTLAAAPTLVLLDEPFSNLDASLREQARRDVRQTLQEQGIAAILVTHDREEALSMGDRVAVMSHGSIKQIGSPETVYHQPMDVNVAGFMGGLLKLPAQAMGCQATCALGTIDLSQPAEGNINLLLRPEQLVLATADSGDMTDDNAAGCQIMGVIEHREFRGHSQMLRVRIGELSVMVQADSLPARQVGDRVYLRCTGHAHVLNDQQTP